MILRLPDALRQTFVTARREVAAYFHSLIAFVVMVLFLVVQGFSFWAVLEVLADPRRPAPYGAVLRTHFGGTFLYWAFLFFVVAATTMRLVAEEKRQGTWEVLLTAPVGEGPALVGKWLGAIAFYATLWAPTVVYVLILRAFAPPGAAPDPGPIATAYLGVLLSGAAFLAVGLATSAATSNQIVAAIGTFAGLVILLLAGLVPEIAPAFVERHATLAAVLERIDVRRQLDDFARGIVDSRHLAFYSGLAGFGLALAYGIARGERRPRERGSGAIGVALVAVIALLGNVLAARHPARLDFTAGRVYTLDAKTRRILADVNRPISVVVIAGDEEVFHELYDEVRELLRQFAAAQPLLEVEEIDPALDPARIEEIAERHALQPSEVAGGGVVVFASGDRREAVALLDMAEFGEGPAGGMLTSFRGEEAFAAAILAVSETTRPPICATRGHGERETGLARVTKALERDGARVEPLWDLEAGVPARCAALAVLGPRQPLSGREAMAIGEYLAKGGRLLVALDAHRAAAADAFVPTGLETILLEHGVRVGAALVRDPRGEIGIPSAWVTLHGYGEHPISAAFRGRRATIWFEPRLVEPYEARGVSATPLVLASEEGFVVGASAAGSGGVGDGDDPKGRDGDEGPSIAVAAEKAETGARVVVFGSARSFSDEILGRGLGVNDALAASAAAWLTGRTKLVGVGPKTPEQFRVIMTAEQLARLFWVCVLGVPGVVAAAGALVHWRRRRDG